MSERVYAHYGEWEDWHAGFYAQPSTGHWSEIQTGWAAGLLADPVELAAAMRWAAEAWPVSASVNLTSTHVNRQAWLGQAAACIRFGVPAALTKQAWHRLTDAQKETANGVADVVLSGWEAKWEANNPSGSAS